MNQIQSQTIKRKQAHLEVVGSSRICEMNNVPGGKDIVNGGQLQRFARLNVARRGQVFRHFGLKGLRVGGTVDTLDDQISLNLNPLGRGNGATLEQNVVGFELTPWKNI